MTKISYKRQFSRFISHNGKIVSNCGGKSRINIVSVGRNHSFVYDI